LAAYYLAKSRTLLGKFKHTASKFLIIGTVGYSHLFKDYQKEGCTNDIHFKENPELAN
jgi:hypothetical protein